MPITWLVVFSPTPLKYDVAWVKVSWDDDIPNRMESENPVMFQTTNQILNINVKGFGFSATPAFAMHVLESPKSACLLWKSSKFAHGAHGLTKLFLFWVLHGKKHQCHQGFRVIICYHDHPCWGLRYLAVPVPLVPERGPTTCNFGGSSQSGSAPRVSWYQLMSIVKNWQNTKGYLTANSYQLLDSQNAKTR